jgi:hypothetical protein
MIPKGGGRRRQTTAWRQSGHGSCQQLAQDKGKRQRQRAGPQAQQAQRWAAAAWHLVPGTARALPRGNPGAVRQSGNEDGRGTRCASRQPEATAAHGRPRTHGPCSAVPQLSIPVPLKLDVTARLSAWLSSLPAGRPGRRQTRRHTRTQQRTLASRSTTCTAGTARRSCASRTAAPSRLAPFGRGQLQLELQPVHVHVHASSASVSVPVGAALPCAASPPSDEGDQHS